MDFSAGVGIEHCEVIFFPVKGLTTDSKKNYCAVCRNLTLPNGTLYPDDVMERNGNIKYFA